MIPEINPEWKLSLVEALPLHIQTLTVHPIPTLCGTRRINQWQKQVHGISWFQTKIAVTN